MISVFIDNCAWDIFNKFSMNLCEELPMDEFEVKMSKEIAEFELPAVPAKDKSLIDYIRRQIHERRIETHSFFGFVSYSDPPGYKPRVGGFNEGCWITDEEAELLERFKVSSDVERPTGLYKNEADASLAVRACSGSVVLTAESSSKRGPLKKAALYGGKIVYLQHFDPTKTRLRDLILESYRVGVVDCSM